MALLAASAPPRRWPVVHLESELQQLLTPSDRVELGFKLEARVKTPIGTLYARSDRDRRVSAILTRARDSVA
jgi:hypothetical protein